MTLEQRDRLDADVLAKLVLAKMSIDTTEVAYYVRHWRTADFHGMVLRSLRRLERRGLVTGTKVGGRWHWQAVPQ